MTLGTIGRTITGPTLGILVLASCPTFVLGQSTGLRVGAPVVAKYQAMLTYDNRVVDSGNVHRIYTVGNIQGTSILLVADGVMGWTRTSEVVPFDQALDFYSGEIRRQPTHPRPYFQRGLIWGDRGELDRAITDFTQAIRIDPNNKASYLARGTTWRDKKVPENAITDYTEAIRLDPTYARAYRMRGLCWMDKKEYDIAVADFTDVIRLRPSSPIGYTDRGLAWERKGDYERAVADFTESLRHEPNDAWTYNNRGNAWRAKREFDKAIADYGEALKLDPDFTWAYINRALARGAKRDYDQAIADLDRAIARDPRNAYAYHDRALFEERKQDYAKATADFNEAIRIEPKIRAARFSLAHLLATCPDPNYRDGPRAVTLATEAYATADQDEAASASVVAASFAEAGDYPHAVEWQEKAIRLLPESAGKDEHRARLVLYQAQKPFHRNAEK